MLSQASSCYWVVAFITSPPGTSWAAALGARSLQCTPSFCCESRGAKRRGQGSQDWGWRAASDSRKLALGKQKVSVSEGFEYGSHVNCLSCPCLPLRKGWFTTGTTQIHCTFFLHWAHTLPWKLASEASYMGGVTGTWVRPGVAHVDNYCQHGEWNVNVQICILYLCPWFFHLTFFTSAFTSL